MVNARNDYGLGEAAIVDHEPRVVTAHCFAPLMDRLWVFMLGVSIIVLALA